MSEPNDRELSLADLAPERLTFRDTAYGGEGARHEWLSIDDLGIEHIAQLRRIQNDLAAATRVLVKAAATDEELTGAVTKLGAGLDAFLCLMLPTLPRDRLAPGGIPLRGKQYMVEWWKARQPTPAEPDAPLAPAAPAIPRARRSRGSSLPTA